MPAPSEGHWHAERQRTRPGARLGDTGRGMDGWPPIDEPELRRRLALDGDAFVAFMTEIIASVGPRPFDDAAFAVAVGYPWSRPTASFRLDGERVVPLAAPPGLVRAGRHPLLAIGSNGAPATLIRKFAHLPAAEQGIDVEVGDLHDFDVAAVAVPTAYGSFAATLVPSTGVALRAALLWVTPAQLTALAWTEVSYRLGRLDGIRFVPDGPDAEPVGAALAFVSRWGAHCRDGAPAALAALPATGRTVRAYTQEDLLARLAREALGPGATARDLVAAIFADAAVLVEVLRPALAPAARSFASERWTPYPG